jgi:glycosyltransferase involved in cell wall biosynthesis
MPGCPEVSVIVPFFNAAAYLDRCIEGLLGQRFASDRYEVLMVDNNSTDRGAEIVARNPVIVLLREEKQGAYAARNRALEQARGRVLAFTDPDCVPHPDWLSQLVAPLGHSGIQVTIGRSHPASRSQALASVSMYDHHKDVWTFSSDDPTLYYGRTNNLAARREAIEACGPFADLRRGADTVFVRRVTERFGTEAVEYVPEARVLHLEIDGLAAYFRKIPIYGRSGVGFRELARKRPLTLRERLRIVRRTVRSGDVSRAGALQLVALLASGVALSRVGALRGRVDRY